MYLQHWGLSRKPFESAADPDFYYPSEPSQGALLKLRYAVESRRSCAMLTGGSGVGKTLIVRSLLRQLDESFQPQVHVVFPQMSPAELVAYIADALQAPPTGAQGMHADVRRIEQVITDGAAAGRHAVVAVDEAHLLDRPETLETLRLLMNIEGPTHPALTLLIVGQSSLLPVLDRTTALEERMAIKCLLRPLSADETVAYVTHRLRVAGGEHEIFVPEALDRLHEITSGSPRLINRLCDLALLVGFAQEQCQIGPDELEEVAEELVAVTPD